MKINQNVMKILIRSTTEENVLFLPKIQLDRKLYLEVNKCLESIGGSWNRKLKGHLFQFDPSDLLDELINTGEYIDKKKEFQFFETPVELAKRLIQLAEIKNDDSILEPSAGLGRICDQFPKTNKDILLIELNKDNFEKLSLKYPAYQLLNFDFLQYNLDEQFDKFDKIIMNPPFSKQQDVNHIFHAWNYCLASNGKLVSIVSESPFFRENKLSKDFREWLESNNAKVIDLESGEFKESGTNVKTRIIIINKKENK